MCPPKSNRFYRFFLFWQHVDRSFHHISKHFISTTFFLAKIKIIYSKAIEPIAFWWILDLNNSMLHCVKSVCIRRFSVPHFLAFVLNTEIYRVHLRIYSESGEMRTRKTPNIDTFNAMLTTTTIIWFTLINVNFSINLRLRKTCQI